MDNKWTMDEWQGCYPSQWKGVIVPEAMAHPAKFSSRLIRRIYEHLFEEGWLHAGDRVLDPFAGVALGALHAMEMGLHWTGVELEPRFVELGGGFDCPGYSQAEWRRYYGRAKRINFSYNHHWCPECVGSLEAFRKDIFSQNGSHIPQADAHHFRGNLDLWKAKNARLPGWNGEAHLLQGDSRHLLELIKAAEVSVSSPPYKNEVEGGGLNINKPATFRGVLKDGTLSMGSSPGNFGGMPDGNFQSVVTSPPFRHSQGGTPEPKPGGVIDKRLYARHAAGNSAAEGYGTEVGQLANMQDRNFKGAVSSPPFESTLSADRVLPDQRRKLAREKGISNAEYISPIDMEAIGGRAQKDARYGFSEGQLGADAGDDFWRAARLIVEQVHGALVDGGHACWVVKDFVRDGERVPFSDQWRQLCEAAGFRTIHEHRASLVHRRGKNVNFEGEVVETVTETKSFFRRIAEQKGSPRIDHETVWCMEKRGKSGQ